MTEQEIAMNDGYCTKCGALIFDPEACHECDTIIVNGDDQYTAYDYPVDDPRDPNDVPDNEIERMIEADHFEKGYVSTHCNPNWDMTGTACK